MNIDAFFKLSYGLYIVAARNKQGLLNGHINNTCFQITSDPPQFAVSINKDNLTADYVKENGAFCISILHDKVDPDIIKTFGFKSGRDTNKFEKVDFELGKSGAPIVKEHVAAFIECKVVQEIEVDTHILFIGKALNADVIDTEAVAITYERYRNEIKGRAPKNAPTFYSKKLKEKLEKELTEATPPLNINRNMKKWICNDCGWEYDPEVGDPENGIAPGTPFEDLPDDWECPDCGAPKENFEPVE